MELKAESSLKLRQGSFNYSFNNYLLAPTTIHTSGTELRVIDTAVINRVADFNPAKILVKERGEGGECETLLQDKNLGLIKEHSPAPGGISQLLWNVDYFGSSNSFALRMRVFIALTLFLFHYCMQGIYSEDSSFLNFLVF